MNPNIKMNFDQSEYKILYVKYKVYLLPFIVVTVSIILFIQFIIPQINEYNERKQQEKALVEKLTLLKDNLTYLSSLDDAKLDSNLRLVEDAYPRKKDYVGIIKAISRGATTTGVTIGDYGFSVGDLSTKSAQVIERPAISLNLTAIATIPKTKEFLKNFSTLFPLSEFVSVNSSGTNATFAVIFFYKPFFVAEKNVSEPVSELSKDEEELIKKLESYTLPSFLTPVIPIPSPQPTASPSASIVIPSPISTGSATIP